jgi:molybdopterin synthase catalytic subunit
MSEDPIQIRILFFASLKDITGKSAVNLTVNKGSSIDDIKKILIQKYPILSEKLKNCLTAIDRKYENDSTRAIAGSEVAFFPPVSGGSFPPSNIRITKDPIDSNEIISKLCNSNTGAVDVFIGVVREQTERATGRFTTKQLEYEAFEAMAIEKMVLIEAEIRQKWKEIEGIAIIQRIGLLTPGTPSVIIACSASHRNSGVFEATRYAIDRLKQIVPVWKKEISKDGEEWIEGDYRPGEGD